MAVKFTVRIGGLSGSTIVNYTPQVPLFHAGESLWSAGMQCNNGGACQFDFMVHDDVGEIPRADFTKTLSSHNQVTISEDAPGFEAWLGRGRIADKGVGREDKPWGNSRAFQVTVDDANTDLRGLTLKASWVRGAESGRARVIALLAAFCNGSPRLTTVISTDFVAGGGEVSMPAKTWPAGTQLVEIIEDCARVEGKVWSVVIHHLASVSHLCFLYVDELDHTTYPCTLSITDSSPNLTTSFPPIWDQGDASVEMGGDNPLSGLVSKYGADDDLFVSVSQADIVSEYDYWVEPYNDSISTTVAQATARANAILRSRRMEHITHQVTIKLRADQVHLLCAGMSIVIRSAAAMGGKYLGTNQTRRIAQLKWELIGPDVGAADGWYYAHMLLDRPEKLLAEGKGTPPIFNPPATPFAAVGLLGAACDNSGSNFATGHAAWGSVNEERVEITLPSSVAVGQSLVAVTGLQQLNWDAEPDTVYDQKGNTWTKDAEYENTGSSSDDTVQIWRCNVTTALAAGDYVRWALNLGASLATNSEAGGRCLGVYAFSGTLSVASVGTGAGAFSNSPAINTPAGSLVVSGLGGPDSQGGATTITADPDWTAMVPATQIAGSGDLASGVYAQFLTAAGATTWTPTLSSVEDWAAIAVAYNTTGTTGATTQPVGGTGSAAPGTSGGGSHEDHVHDHANITTGGPYHMAEDVTFAPHGSIAATNVQAAIQEVRDEAGSSSLDPLIAPGRVQFSGEIVSTVNADQNDFAPTDLHNKASIRFTSFSANRTITGIDAGSSGDLLILVNNTSFSLLLPNESGSSVAANRFRSPNAATHTVRQQGSALLVYLGGRWCVIAA